jgi:hypothetical protein
MAIFVLKDTSVTVNSIDLTSYVTNVELVQAVDSVEATVMSSTSVNGHQFVGGIQNNMVTISFNQDFATSKVHATLTALVGVQTTVVVKPTSAAVGATNPNFTITNCLMNEYRPVTGAVGDLATVGSISFAGGLYTAPIA